MRIWIGGEGYRGKFRDVTSDRGEGYRGQRARGDPPPGIGGAEGAAGKIVDFGPRIFGKSLVKHSFPTSIFLAHRETAESREGGGRGIGVRVSHFR